MAWLRFETPFGPMALEGETALTRLWLPGTLPDLRGRGDETPLLRAAREALLAYFAGERRDFDLPLARRGRTFSARFGRL